MRLVQASRPARELPSDLHSSDGDNVERERERERCKPESQPHNTRRQSQRNEADRERDNRKSWPSLVLEEEEERGEGRELKNAPDDRYDNCLVVSLLVICCCCSCSCACCYCYPFWFAYNNNWAAGLKSSIRSDSSNSNVPACQSSVCVSKCVE